jgi:hypothetical protein
VLIRSAEDLGVKELMLADDRGVFFTTPHFDGYSAVLMRIPDLARIDREELRDGRAARAGWDRSRAPSRGRGPPGSLIFLDEVAVVREHARDATWLSPHGERLR